VLPGMDQVDVRPRQRPPQRGRFDEVGAGAEEDGDGHELGGACVRALPMGSMRGRCFELLQSEAQ